jgi:hypothetical protein
MQNNGIDLLKDNIFFCEAFRTDKPYPIVYQHYLKQSGGEDEVWFATAHMWDYAAAKANGYVELFFSLVFDSLLIVW